MISRETVLILGAGASFPFGFPLGYQLKDRVCQELSNPKLRNFIQLCTMGYDSKDIQEFRDALYKTPLDSVDAFLEYNQDLIEIGKIAIAQILIPCETEGTLFHPRRFPDELWGSGNWYKYLFNRCDTSFEDFNKNKLSILTYNYDRSLEYFLFVGLRNTYRKKTKEECLEQLSKIPIIHLHGRVGTLNWESGDQIVSYGAYEKQGHEYIINDSVLEIARNNIKIICEDIKEDAQFKTAHTLLEKAEIIHFIGFGYNNTNLERLNPKISFKDKLICGTGYGLSNKEKTVIESLLRIHKPLSADLYNKDLDAYAFMREAPI